MGCYAASWHPAKSHGHLQASGTGMGSGSKLRGSASNYLRMVSFKQMKVCKKCGVDKNFVDFYFNRGSPRSQCKECVKASRRENWRKYPENRNVAKRQAWARKHKYGLTELAYTTLLESQGGGCAICRGDFRLSVDHCHVTGKIRGILCGHCNRGLGGFRDNPDLVLGALNYLQK